jgi:hypothetical protein
MERFALAKQDRTWLPGESFMQNGVKVLDEKKKARIAPRLFPFREGRLRRNNTS